MKKVMVFCIYLFITGTLGSCKSYNYFISIDPNYTGWIYIVNSNDSIKGYTFYADNFGVVYLPSKLFENSNARLSLKVGDSLAENDVLKIYRIEFYPEDKGKLIYYKFYYPFTTSLPKERAYKYKSRDLPEFDYLYYSNTINKERIAQ